MEALFIVLAIALAVVLWNLRHAFFAQSGVWKEKVELVAKDSSVDLQEDYKDLHDRINTTKTSHDGKWFKMSDIDELMK